jgi:hypothetical protein
MAGMSLTLLQPKVKAWFIVTNITVNNKKRFTQKEGMITMEGTSEKGDYLI